MSDSNVHNETLKSALQNIPDTHIAALILGQNRALELALRGAPLENALEILTQTAQHHVSDGALASILLLDAKTKKLHAGAVSNLPKSYNNAINGVSIGPHVGSCGTAAYTRRTVVVSDIANDPLWANFKSTALLHDLKACWSVPIFSSQGEVLGTFALYYKQVRVPAPRDLEVVDLLTKTTALIIETAVDVSEQLKARQVIQESETRFKSLADSMPQVVWTARPDGILDYANQRWIDYSGSKVPEDWHLFVHPEDIERSFAGWSHCIATGELYEVEFRLRRASDQSYRWHLVRAAPVRNQAGQIERWYGTCTDIEDQKLSAQALLIANRSAEAANYAKSSFLANMSHEIRTPLGAIMGFVSLMKNPDLNRESLDKYISVIERNSDQLLRIIDDILDLSKVEAGKLLLEKLEFSLPEALENFSSIFGFRAKENGINFDLVARTLLPEIIISDSIRLRQILSNIVSNAIKFTEKGSVTLSVAFHNPVLEFTVTDTGIGISTEQAQQLFQPFHQADISTSRRFGGTGLGLALTKSLCEALGGEFYLESSTPGKGSVFIARIKVDIPQQTKLVHAAHVKYSNAPKPQNNLAKTLFKNLEILVVDDSSDNSTLVSILLSELSAKVETASDGAMGIKLALSKPYNVILMDIQMPQMDGHEATRKLRSLGYSGPIIALTAHAMKEERQRVLESGFSGFLSKPIRRQALFETIAEFTNIQLPASKSKNDSVSPQSKQLPTPVTAPQILIIEDDIDMRTAMCELLESENYRFTTASNGLEVLEYLETNELPPLVFMDLTLPKMTGSELIARLNARTDRNKTHIIVASGWDDLKKRASDLGADGHLKKPFDLFNFLKLVKSVLK